MELACQAARRRTSEVGGLTLSFLFAHRNGGWSYRFDPACYAARHPVDAWPLLPRIQAPTLIVRGELSPIPARDGRADA